MFYIFAPGPHTQNLGFSIIISIRPVYAIDLRFMYDQPDRNGKSEQFHSYAGIPQVRNRNSDQEKFSRWENYKICILYYVVTLLCLYSVRVLVLQI